MPMYFKAHTALMPNARISTLECRMPDSQALTSAVENACSALKPRLWAYCRIE